MHLGASTTVPGCSSTARPHALRPTGLLGGCSEVGAALQIPRMLASIYGRQYNVSRFSGSAELRSSLLPILASPSPTPSCELFPDLRNTGSIQLLLVQPLHEEKRFKFTPASPFKTLSISQRATAPQRPVEVWSCELSPAARLNTGPSVLHQGLWCSRRN